MGCCIQKGFIILFLIFYAITASECTGRKSGLQKPSAKERGPIDLWNTVTEDTNVVFHIRLGNLLDVPLFGFLIEILKQEITKKSAGVADKSTEEAMQDLIYEITDVFVTGNGIDNANIIIRFKKEVNNLPEIRRFVSFLGTGQYDADLRDVTVCGRKAITVDGDMFTAIEIDQWTVAMLKKAPKDAEEWFNRIFKPEKKRDSILNAVKTLQGEEVFAGLSYSLIVYLGKNFSSNSSGISKFSNVSNISDVSDAILMVAVSRDASFALEVRYEAEEEAKKLEEEVKNIFVEPPPVISLFQEQLKLIEKSFSIMRNGNLVKIRCKIPESVLDTAYVALKMFLDVKQQKKEEKAGQQ